ncbi:Na+/H+ antiporter NhaC family protein, partial [Dasania marina]|uniref:Na+/H+ antiporter NhaC family protein n=1 Tax=Dasania marina TaxID=471499 RepID=UPI0030DB7104
DSTSWPLSYQLHLLSETAGLLARLVQGVLTSVKSTGSLIAVTIASCIGANIITADQYIAIVLPGRMYRLEFERRGLAPENLSRVLEDSATITSPLIPWNTCGAFMASTLGVATFAYLPYCFFNIINPIISLIYGFTGFKLTPLKKNVVQESTVKNGTVENNTMENIPIKNNAEQEPVNKDALALSTAK